MDWLTGITTVAAFWMFLALLGRERDRRTRELDYQIARTTAEAARAAQAAAETAARQAQSNR